MNRATEMIDHWIQHCDEIKFSPSQSLPYGYEVIYSRDTEHYHWINIIKDIESCVYSCRWHARRDAIAHWKKYGQGH